MGKSESRNWPEWGFFFGGYGTFVSDAKKTSEVRARQQL